MAELWQEVKYENINNAQFVLDSVCVKSRISVFLFSLFSGLCGNFDNKGQEGTKQQRKDLSQIESRSSLLAEIHDASMTLSQFIANA